MVLINGREVSSMTHDQVREVARKMRMVLGMIMRIIMRMIRMIMAMIMIMAIMTQVVNFIRAAREPHSGSLVLAVRQVLWTRWWIFGDFLDYGDGGDFKYNQRLWTNIVHRPASLLAECVPG